MFTWILEHRLAKIAKRAQDHINNGIPSGNVVYSDLYAEAKSLAIKQQLSINEFHSRYPAMKQLHKLQDCKWFGKNSLSRMLILIFPLAVTLAAIILRLFPNLR